MGDGTTHQKEWFSRAWVVAAASAANFTYNIEKDDNRGVDMSVHQDVHTVDFQLKATSHPERQGDNLVFDLDVRTYNLLRVTNRSGYGVLVLAVMAGDTEEWVEITDSQTTLRYAAYYLPLMGLPPTDNAETIRLKIPLANLLTTEAMRLLMKAQEARWAA